MFKFIFPTRCKICIFLGAVVFCFLPVAVFSQSSQNINVCKFKFAVMAFLLIESDFFLFFEKRNLFCVSLTNLRCY